MKERRKSVGRPRLPEHMKAKPISKMIRVSLDIANDLKKVSDMYKVGSISADDIRSLLNAGNARKQNDLRL